VALYFLSSDYFVYLLFIYLRLLGLVERY